MGAIESLDALLSPDANPSMEAPLRIWSIITSLTSGGAEMLVSNLSSAYSSQRATSIVIALCDAETLGNSAEMEAKLASRIRDGGGEFHSLRLSHRRKPLEGAVALRRLLGQERPDVLHCHTARAVSMVGLSGYRGPVVLTHHNSKLSFSPRLIPFFDLVVDRYIAICPDIADIYREWSNRPFTVIPNAAAVEFRADKPREAISDPCRLLSVGAISAQKNYHFLLDTARQLLDQDRSFAMPKFRIAGNGPDLNTLRQKARDMGLADHVEFLGERSDIAALLEDSDLFLNTSTYEGLPVAILEAFGMALPVVASDVAGNHDLVTHGKAGVLSPLNDAPAMAKAIGDLIGNPDYYRRLSAGALERSKRYTLDGASRRHMELFASLAPKGRKHIQTV